MLLGICTDLFISFSVGFNSSGLVVTSSSTVDFNLSFCSLEAVTLFSGLIPLFLIVSSCLLSVFLDRFLVGFSTSSFETISLSKLSSLFSRFLFAVFILSLGLFSVDFLA